MNVCTTTGVAHCTAPRHTSRLALVCGRAQVRSLLYVPISRIDRCTLQESSRLAPPPRASVLDRADARNS
eukprot:5659902-Prymnesium_polylepis.2